MWRFRIGYSDGRFMKMTRAFAILPMLSFFNRVTHYSNTSLSSLIPKSYIFISYKSSFITHHSSFPRDPSPISYHLTPNDIHASSPKINKLLNYKIPKFYSLTFNFKLSTFNIRKADQPFEFFPCT